MFGPRPGRQFAVSAALENSLLNRWEFRIENRDVPGAVSSVITLIHIETGSGPSHVRAGSFIFSDGSTGFVFGQASGPGLPDEDAPNPPFTSDYFIRTVDPLPQNGVEVGEFQIQGIRFETPFDGSAALASGALRVGIFVQSIGGPAGGSDSFVTGPPVPEPSTLALVLLAAGGTFIAKRR